VQFWNEEIFYSDYGIRARTYSFVFPPRDEFPGKRRKSESPYFESNSSFGRRHVARSVRVYFLPVQCGSTELLASRDCMIYSDGTA